MKNANIFVDVDLTLVDVDLKLLPGARESLTKLKDAGCHLFLWSSNGRDYAMKIAALHGLTDLFEAFAAKSDIVIDDMPGTAHPAFAVNVSREPGWPRWSRTSSANTSIRRGESRWDAPTRSLAADVRSWILWDPDLTISRIVAEPDPCSSVKSVSSQGRPLCHLASASHGDSWSGSAVCSDGSLVLNVIGAFAWWA